MVGGIPAVFSSQHAVRAVAPLIAARRGDFQRVFCVGSKTALALARCAVHPECVAPCAAALAAEIAVREAVDSLNYFCGRLRRDELPARLGSAGIRVLEVVVYDTFHTPQQLREPFDIALFYSPSGVQSFLRCNALEPRQTAVAIGPTTAACLERVHPNTVVAAQPTVEHVLRKALELLH